MKKKALVGIVLFSQATLACAEKPPIIDVHLHADPVSNYGPPGQSFCMEMLATVPAHDPATGPWPPKYMQMLLNPGCDDPIPAAEDDDALMRETLAAMERHNITGIVSAHPDIVAKWKAAAPDRVIAGRSFDLRRSAGVTPADLEAEFRAGKFEVLAEVTNQYAGIGPDSPRFAAYWQVAEDNDIPVGIHIGTLPPGSPYMFEGARVRLGNPLLLEEVLVKHPNLRVYVMHAGMPFLDNIVALMQVYPQVYAGSGVLQAVLSKEAYDAFLERMVRAGLGKRIMYGTDQMIWPGMIDQSVKLVEETTALTPEQKRDFLYNNAVRFFRLER